jgi:hypothetical protein
VFCFSPNAGTGNLFSGHAPQPDLSAQFGILRKMSNPAMLLPIELDLAVNPSIAKAIASRVPDSL